MGAWGALRFPAVSRYRQQMNPQQMKAFVRQRFDGFVKKQDLSAADRNFGLEYQEHGTDVPAGYPAGPKDPKIYLAAAFNLAAPHPVH